jgi:hypothetical protein
MSISNLEDDGFECPPSEDEFKKERYVLYGPPKLKNEGAHFFKH